MVRWSADDLGEQSRRLARAVGDRAIHRHDRRRGLLRSRDVARRLGVTLLDSYVSLGETAVPRDAPDPAEMYAALRRGERVSTSQAWLRAPPALRQDAAVARARALRLRRLGVHGEPQAGRGVAAGARPGRSPDGAGQRRRLPGRLGLIARAAARRAQSSADAEDVIAFARWAAEACREWVFLDKLHWLAVGGRLSKPGAFFGDLLHVKLIISPLPEGAKKVGTVRRAADQLPLALARLEETLGPRGAGTVLLEHSDNRERIEREIEPAVRGALSGGDDRARPRVVDLRRALRARHVGCSRVAVGSVISPRFAARCARRDG